MTPAELTRFLLDVTFDDLRARQRAEEDRRAREALDTYINARTTHRVREEEPAPCQPPENR